MLSSEDWARLVVFEKELQMVGIDDADKMKWFVAKFLEMSDM